MQEDLSDVSTSRSGERQESTAKEKKKKKREKESARVGRERRRGVLYPLFSPLASLSLDTPFSGSPTPDGEPWFPFSPHRDTENVTHPEKGQSVGRSVASELSLLSSGNWP